MTKKIDGIDYQEMNVQFHSIISISHIELFDPELLEFVEAVKNLDYNFLYGRGCELRNKVLTEIIRSPLSLQISYDEGYINLIKKLSILFFGLLNDGKTWIDIADYSDGFSQDYDKMDLYALRNIVNARIKNLFENQNPMEFKSRIRIILKMLAIILTHRDFTHLTSS